MIKRLKERKESQAEQGEGDKLAEGGKVTCQATKGKGMIKLQKGRAG